MVLKTIKKPIYILGTGLSHDGSACLLKDGKICVAIEKERITRKKHDGQNDTAAIKYCLDSEKITLSDLSLVIQNTNFGSFEHGNNYYYGERLFNEKVNVPIITISHHLAHAYNAIGTMPFTSAAILVIDGCGSFMDDCIDLDGAIIPETVPKNIQHLYAEKDSFYIYDNAQLKVVHKDFSPLGLSLKEYPMHPTTTKDSIGGLYRAVSDYVFGNMMDEGKLMGLAPYGRPGIYNEKIFKFKDGRVFVNYNWMKQFKQSVHSYNVFQKNFQYYADIAYWVQKEIEQAILYIINSRYSLTNIESLAYTGGVALNAVSNSKILTQGPFKNLYITPAAGDNGIAIGCAYYGWLEILKKPKSLHDGNTFLGKVYSQKSIQKDIITYLTPSVFNDKVMIKQLFTILPQCFKVGVGKINSSYKIQFILDTNSSYALSITKEKIEAIHGCIQKPDCTLYCDVMVLFNALSDRNFYIDAIYNKKIIEVGNSNILFKFDPIKITEKIYQLIQNSELDKNQIKYYHSNNIIKDTAKLLAKGKVVAWFQDGSEFGPRALGHRSILADPRAVSIKDFINLNIKFREDFRPFAPSILQEDVSEYFYFKGESPYMILTAQAKDICKQRCPGIVHADSSSRIQTVTTELNTKYYQLIKEFKKLTGIPMLLNTSLNKKGMQIIETPKQALSFFYECALDNLVIHDYLISK